MPWMGVEWENLNWIQPLNHSRLFNPQKGNFVRFYRCQNTPLNRKLECLKCVQPFKFIQVYSRVFKTFQDLNALFGLFIGVETLNKLEWIWMLSTFQLFKFSFKFSQVYSRLFKTWVCFWLIPSLLKSWINLNEFECIQPLKPFKFSFKFFQGFSRG